MSRAQSPASILSESLETLGHQLDSIRGGNEETVHDARSMIRRTREVVALLRECSGDDLDDLERTLRRVGRALGRARDADVRQHLVRYAAARLRLRSNLFGLLESAIRDDQHTNLRRAIKTVEGVDLASDARRWAARGGRSDRRCAREVLRHQIASRATSVAEHIAQTGGVYFPNRLHSMRLAGKQLRYAIELADRLNVRRPPRALRPLRATQELLGDLHDRESLLELLANTPLQADDESRDTVRHFIVAEMSDIHSRYLAQREPLLAICEACVRLAAASPPRFRLLLAAAAAVNSALIVRAVTTRRRTAASASGRLDIAARYQPAS